MKLSQKLGKATHPDFFPYVFHRWRSALRRSVPVAQVMRLVDQEKFAALKARYFNSSETVHPPKYLKAEEWIPKNLRRARDAGITPAPPKKKVLDIGCGVGWFLLVARAMGHEVRGIDIEGDPIYREMTSLLEIPRTIHAIRPYEPLPAEIQGFDIVSAHMTCFNRYPDKRHWGSEEWTFFLKDLRGRLNPGATIAIELNPRADGSRMADDLRLWFQQQGARVIFGRVLFPPLVK
jgi:SAM-dependent methyltransferase